MHEIDVVVPVHNEEAVLRRSILRLHRFLGAELPFSWRIVISSPGSCAGSPCCGWRRRAADLRGLLPLVAPLLSGHSDVAIGSAS